MNDRNLYDYVVRLGDNALILSHRLGEWVGKGPELEEEMALANFALDYIGQARLFYSLATELSGQDCSEDELAFLRDPLDYRNVLLVEQPNGNFADTVARQFLFESYYLLFLEDLSQSTNSRLAEIATKAAKEVAYHVRHYSQWLLRLGDGTELSHQRMQQAVDILWQFTGELFSVDTVDEAMIKMAVAPDPAGIKSRWDTFVAEALTAATLEKPEDAWMADGGKQGRHSEHFGYILADMQFMQRTYPGATW